MYSGLEEGPEALKSSTQPQIHARKGPVCPDCMEESLVPGPIFGRGAQPQGPLYLHREGRGCKLPTPGSLSPFSSQGQEDGIPIQTLGLWQPSYYTLFLYGSPMAGLLLKLKGKASRRFFHAVRS